MIIEKKCKKCSSFLIYTQDSLEAIIKKRKETFSTNTITANIYFNNNLKNDDSIMLENNIWKLLTCCAIVCASLCSAGKVMASQSIWDAVRSNDVAGIKRFIAAGADINVTNEYGETPLHRAILTSNKKAFDALIKAPGIDIDAVDKYGLTPLHRAIETQNHVDFDALINAPGVDIVDQYGSTPLLRAFERKFPQKVFSQFAKTLIMHGASVNKVMRDDGKMISMPPTHIAALVSNEEVLTELLNMGADVDAKNEHGETALDFCSTKNVHNNSAKILKSEGASISQKKS